MDKEVEWLPKAQHKTRSSQRCGGGGVTAKGTGAVYNGVSFQLESKIFNNKHISITNTNTSNFFGIDYVVQF